MTEHDIFAKHRPEVGDSETTGQNEFLVRHSQLRTLGGATLIWHGIAMRMKPEDFQMGTRIGLGANWPFGYDELERHYAKAEATLQVAGDVGDPGHPPRSSPFPLPAMPFELDDGPFINAMRRRGATVQRQCIARNTASINGRSQCQSTGTCRYCPFGARFTGDQLLEDVAKRPGVQVISATAALRLIFSTQTSAAALEARNTQSGKTIRIEADRFVVCGGGIESPKLLINSRSRWWPSGVGNHGEMLGKFFFTHPLLVMMGRRSPNPKRVTKELGYPTATSRYYDDAAFQRDGKFTVQCWGLGHDLGTMMIDGAKRGDIERRIEAENTTSLAILADEVPEAGNTVGLAARVDRYGLPRTRIHYTWGARTHSQLARIKKAVTSLAGGSVWVPLAAMMDPSLANWAPRAGERTPDWYLPVLASRSVRCTPVLNSNSRFGENTSVGLRVCSSRIWNRLVPVADSYTAM
ncbi:MAG: GMC family oxidoreductase N-terminal domain-containing protein [Proteobacteria bacterium]|nr:GMC family oxidoreductase N-terminal domain-containing protein [Pseudomonadota bacterium]